MALARWTWPIWRFSVEGGGRREGRARRRAASRPSWASAASRTDGQTSSRPGGLEEGVVRRMRVERRSSKFAGRRGARSSGVGSAGGTGSSRGESEGRGQRHLPELQPLRGERNGEEEVRNIGFREVWREEEVGHGVGGTGAPVGRGTRDSDSERRCGETTNLGKSNEELTTPSVQVAMVLPKVSQVSHFAPSFRPQQPTFSFTRNAFPPAPPPPGPSAYGSPHAVGGRDSQAPGAGASGAGGAGAGGRWNAGNRNNWSFQVGLSVSKG